MRQARSRTALTHWFTWRHVRCKLVKRPHPLGQATDTLLELHVIAARDTPVPLTATGFRAEFVSADVLRHAGGAVAYIAALKDREAKVRPYQRAEFLWRQGNLFDPLDLDDESPEA